jgi:hypothetical protein
MKKLLGTMSNCKIFAKNVNIDRIKIKTKYFVRFKILKLLSR